MQQQSDTPVMNSSEYMAARTIQAAVHNFLFRKRMRDFAVLAELKADLEESRRLGLAILGLLGDEEGSLVEGGAAGGAAER